LHARSARQHHAPRRYSSDEYLQQALSCAPGTISVEVFADDPCRNGAPAELGAVSHLQNVVVEPGHACSPGHHQSFQTNSRFAWRKAVARALSYRHSAKTLVDFTNRKV